MSAGLEARLRGILAERYHDRHPFNLRLHGGDCEPDEVRRWVRNRYYYQTRIPIKDGVILTKSEDRAFRRGWIRRIHDHDGDDRNQGGLELWLQLAVACGLDRDETASLRQVLPGVRRACDSYVTFVESHDLLESVASSLTELAAGAYLGHRAEAFRKYYDWIAEDGLDYFLSRTHQAPRDAEEGLAFVLEHADTTEREERCVAALEKKCSILWQLLDGVEWGGRRPQLANGARLRTGDEPMVVSPERAIRIGGSGASILEACDGSRCVDEVAVSVREAFPDAPNGLESDVYAFIEEMERAHVLELPE